MPDARLHRSPADADALPRLESGDRLTREDFHRRYELRPDLRAELIDGVVYVSSPVSHGRHGKQHLDLSTWIGFYAARTPGVDAGNESTVILAGDNELQPDVLLRTEAGRGGRSVETDGEYLQGAPDLVAEVAASSKARDLGPRKKVLRENGAREYLLWRVVDRELDWFELHDGEYRRLERDADGLLKSGIFPGLWLDVEALLRRDITAVLATLERGMASSEYGGFDERVRGDSGE